MSVKKGDNIKVHYVGTLNNGDEFDNSYKRGSTLDFTAGSGQMIKGFDDAVIGMNIGDKKSVNISSDMAYGTKNPRAIIPVSKNQFGDDFNFVIGGIVEGQDANGNPMRGEILEIRDDNVLLDFNHPLADQDLNFEIELVAID